MAKVFSRNPRAAGRVIDGQAFVVTPDDNKLHALNATGTRVWELAASGSTVDDLAAALAARFDVDAARAREDASIFCEDLVKRGILVAT